MSGGEAGAHMACGCRLVLWPVFHPDVHSVPRPDSGRLSNIQVTETISEDGVFLAGDSGCGRR